MARLARARHVAVDFLQADVFNWDWPNETFDAVVGIFIQFAGPDERPRQLAGMKQAFRPGGLLFLQGYTSKQLENGTGGPSTMENLYTEALLREVFRDWEIMMLREHDDLLEEGRGGPLRSIGADRPDRKIVSYR